MSFSVTHWETVCSKTIPICEPDRCTFSNNASFVDTMDDVSSRYINISLTDLGCPQDARKCRKLLKKGYKFELVETRAICSESELQNFLYYKVVLISPGRPIIKHHFYFKRNQELCKISDSCYASDDNGIAFFKLQGRRLRCGFVDIKSCSYQQLSIHLVPTVCMAKVCKKSVWVVVINADHLNVYLMRFAEKSSTAWIQFEYERAPPPHQILENLTVSDRIFMLDKLNLYLQYDTEKQKILAKTVPIEYFAKTISNKVVGDYCLMTPKENKNGQRKIQVALLFPDFQVIKVVDILASLPNCLQYIPSGFELWTFPSCMKALVESGESYVVVIDLKTLAVSQILTYIDCFWEHKLKLQFSRDGESLRFLGHYRSINDPNVTSYLTLKFNIWHGMSLKSFCLQTLVKNFSLAGLRSCNLPRQLLKEIEGNFF